MLSSLLLVALILIKLDMEVAFENEHDVMRRMEVLLHNIWPKKSPVGLPDLKLPETFDRMTYHEAMASYGSDKPDLRFDMKVSAPRSSQCSLLT